jgi:hypothetical protein
MKNLVVLVLLGVSLALFFGMGKFAKNLGVERFPERSLFYKSGALGKLVQNRAVAETYVWPVLFPVDLLFMFIAAGSMAWASYIWGPSIGIFSDRSWLFLMLPLAYLVLDLAEDSLLALVLKQSVPLNDGVFAALKALTFGKIATNGLAVLQTVIAGFFFLRS